MATIAMVTQVPKHIFLFEISIYLSTTFIPYTTFFDFCSYYKFQVTFSKEVLFSQRLCGSFAQMRVGVFKVSCHHFRTHFCLATKWIHKLQSYIYHMTPKNLCSRGGATSAKTRGFFRIRL